MAASRVNYIIFHDGLSQTYGAASKEIALTSPLPPGRSIEHRHVGFITYEPDKEQLVIHLLPQEEVLNAELKADAKKKSEDES